MIADAIKEIQEMSRAAGSVEVIAPPGLRGRRFGLRAPGQDIDCIEWFDALPPPRDYALFTVEDFIAAAKRFGDPEGTIVFCGRGKVVAVLRESSGLRDERLCLPLPYSKEFETLRSEADRRTPRNQREFLNDLRIDLAGCVDADLICQIRALKFVEHKEGASTVQQSKESLGASVEREVHADGKEIPENSTLRVCVYRDLAADGLRMPIACAIDVNLAEQRFTLIPKAGELERAEQDTDTYVQRKLVDNGLNVLCGSPWGGSSRVRE